MYSADCVTVGKVEVKPVTEQLSRIAERFATRDGWKRSG